MAVQARGWARQEPERFGALIVVDYLDSAREESRMPRRVSGVHELVEVVRDRFAFVVWAIDVDVWSSKRLDETMEAPSKATLFTKGFQEHGERRVSIVIDL